ncbi:hypothetical protein [Clostridium novyi]|nr:hypothetical protein [Clostridium novyi]
MKMFWTILTAVALIWYVFTTLIVGVKGYQDLEKMLQTIGARNNQ